MIRTLAALNVFLALLSASPLVFWLMLTLVPGTAARLHMTDGRELVSRLPSEPSPDTMPVVVPDAPVGVIGGADGPTTYFVMPSTIGESPFGSAVLVTALLGNAIVLWRRRDARPAAQSGTPGQGATVSS